MGQDAFLSDFQNYLLKETEHFPALEVLKRVKKKTMVML